MSDDRPVRFVIESTDCVFLCKLIGWVNKQTVKPNSTVLRVEQPELPEGPEGEE